MTRSHPLAGKTVILNETTFVREGVDEALGLPPLEDVVNPAPGLEFRVEDYWDSFGQGTWEDGAIAGNPACLKYTMRFMASELPPDNEVVYGKIGNYGHLVHVSELGEEVKS